MRIISCHIENFGKIHEYSRDFCGEANIICEENGWGKSTFVAFIRAMFYGLEGDRKRSIEENERKRYLPWQGGVFGGRLVFEIQGKEYVISRVFRDKEANDEFELRDARTNLLSKDYSNKIGEEIFKINRASFMRTILIGQNQCETSPTDDINAKIGKLADNSNDLNNFEAAHAKLTEILNQLNPRRVSGTLSKRREEIARYERLVKGGEGISNSIAMYEKYLHEEELSYELLGEQMKEAGEKQKIVSKRQSAAAKRLEWERLKKSVAKRTEEKEEVRRKFPGKIPTPEAVKEEIIVCGSMERTHERMSLCRLTDAEREEFASLANTFANGIPDDAEIEEKINETKKLRQLSRESLFAQMSDAEKERLSELDVSFANDREAVTAVVEKWNQRNAKKAALPSKQAAFAALQASAESKKRQSGKKLSPLLILGIFFVVLGGVLAAVRFPIPGIIVVVVGIGLVLAGLFAGKKEGAAEQAESVSGFEDLRRDIEADKAWIAQVDKDVADYLLAHGRHFSEDTVSVALQEIIAESMEYASLQKKSRESMDFAKAQEMETLGASVKAFLGGYGVVSTDAKFADDLYLLKSKAEKYRILLDKKSNFEKNAQEYEKDRREVLAFLDEYGYAPSAQISLQLSDIRDLADAYQNAANALAEAEKEKKQFEAGEDVLALEQMQADDALPTLEELNQTIERLTEQREEIHKKIGSYNVTLENLQEEYDEWEENGVRLQELKEQQEIEQKKYRQVDLAKKKLELAKEAMTAKYADPILRGFCNYYEMISGQGASHFHIDANTTITVDELGQQRGTNALSSGYRDLIGICLRIALVEAMYQEETPPLIMDDPFANLDDEKVRAGRKFVEKLAEKYQIIYFTCSALRGV